mgnify:CR=1 FL=1
MKVVFYLSQDFILILNTTIIGNLYVEVWFKVNNIYSDRVAKLVYSINFYSMFEIIDSAFFRRVLFTLNKFIIAIPT